MSSRPSTFRKPSHLSIRPPSPTSLHAPSIQTPNNPSSSYAYFPTGPGGYVSSPRKAPLPPSPTHSTYSYASGSTNTRSSGVGTRGDEVPPPLPAKNDKKLPGIPTGGAGSPHRAYSGVNASQGKGWAATGVYDNRLVSSTLSHLPPIPPVSPTPTSTHGLHPTSSTSLLAHSTNSASPRPSISNPSAVSMSMSMSNPLSSQGAPGVVLLPDGTPLSDHSHTPHGLDGLVGRVAENMTMAHSSPNSPWSLLTVHVLPLFAGSALKTPLEDLNHLCHSHIIATSQRSPPHRVVVLLTSDLREFIASGMLTLKAKFETLEEGKVVSRAAEVWSFFWTQVLPYVEGVFLPFTQLRDVPSSSTSTYLSALFSPIPVRHLLLSGFLLHILLPLLPRIIPQITTPSSPTGSPSFPPPTAQELNKILQMSLVLSTQARYSSFFPSASQGAEDRDEEVRGNVENLGVSVRWRVQQNELEITGAATTALGGSTANSNSPIKSSPIGVGVPGRASLQRGPSLSQSGRYRRRGWRASANLGMGLSQFGSNGGAGQGTGVMSRQNSGDPNMDRWGRPRLEEEDEDEFIRPSNAREEVGTLAPPPPRIRTDTGDSLSINSTLGVNSSMMTSTTGGSTLTAGSTIRGESLASFGETPSASASVTPSAATGIGAPLGSGQQSGTGAGAGAPQGRGEMMYGRPVRRTRAESETSDIARRDRDRDGDRRI